MKIILIVIEKHDCPRLNNETIAETDLTGLDLLDRSTFNKGTAFTEVERDLLRRIAQAAVWQDSIERRPGRPECGPKILANLDAFWRITGGMDIRFGPLEPNGLRPGDQAVSGQVAVIEERKRLAQAI
ncbi:MAG: hypothetical protein ACLP7I_18340 [Limisphaerales bacterium]